MKVIIAGGRELKLSIEEINKIVKASGFEITEVVCGCAKGVDSSGAGWAKSKKIPIHHFPANWDAHGKSAGHIRNRQMAVYADALIAVPGKGPGTRNMIKQAQDDGKPVYVHDLKDPVKSGRVEPDIKQLTLVFPHGITSGICQRIARGAEKIVGAGVSEGGYEITNNQFTDDHLEFSESKMQYIFGHKKVGG